MILCDVDGVLTDGGIWFDNQGVEAKQFHVRDGLGIKLWRDAGFPFGWLTARESHLVKLRAAELDVNLLRQGVQDKLQAARQIADNAGLRLEQIAHIGDDLPDLPLLRAVGLAIAVADAVAEVRAVAHWVSNCPGGQGAVRESIEMILKEKGLWQGIVSRYA
jgi:YrbI family 3-deoxy-D-manno-octulosonate 8-phosphate phosphatase